MLERKLVVKIPRGLQPATHAAMFVQKIYSFNSEVIIIKDGRMVCGGRNVMRSTQLVVKVMDLAIKADDEMTLMVSGIDEHPALMELEKFLLNNDRSLLRFNIEQTKPMDK